jgi:hypothetical protein
MLSNIPGAILPQSRVRGLIVGGAGTVVYRITTLFGGRRT